MATMQHLAECIAKFERERIAAVRPAEVALDHWFHDAVHNVQGHHNEQRSADWARTALGARDAELLIDIDLSILDAPAVRFAAYERQIRAEYDQAPAGSFEPRRREVRRRFVDRDPRYGTTGARAAYEVQAKRDLRAAMS